MRQFRIVYTSFNIFQYYREVFLTSVAFFPQTVAYLCSTVRVWACIIRFWSKRLRSFFFLWKCSFFEGSKAGHILENAYLRETSQPFLTTFVKFFKYVHQPCQGACVWLSHIAFRKPNADNLSVCRPSHSASRQYLINLTLNINLHLFSLVKV